MLSRKKSLSILMVLLFLTPYASAYASSDAATAQGPSGGGSLHFTPHNVTIPIGDSEYLFVGEDLEGKISRFYPELLNNQTAVETLQMYNETLMHSYMINVGNITGDDTYYRYVLFNGLNETHFVEVLFTEQYDANLDHMTITRMEVFSGSSYLEQMKTAWLAVLAANESGKFIIVERWFWPFLWSYSYTQASFMGGVVSYSPLWKNDDLADKLYDLHWEFCTYVLTNVSYIEPVGHPPLLVHREEEMPVEALVCVSLDGEVIQVLCLPPLLDAPPNDMNYLIIVFGIVSLVVVIVVLVRLRSKS